MPEKSLSPHNSLETADKTLPAHTSRQRSRRRHRAGAGAGPGAGGDAPRPPEAICTRSETATPAKSQILPRSVHGLQRECAERRRPGRGARLPFSKPWCASGTSVLVPRQKKTRLNVCETSRRVKKFPAPCYSPIVKFTVPSPLEPLTAVFGKGTCVSAPL